MSDDGLFWTIVITALLLCGGGCGGGCGVACGTGCAPDYSNGTRDGVVRKFSQRGLIWKTWEGEALLTVPGNSVMQPEVFKFTSSPENVEKTQEALRSGKRVSLHYHQYALAPVPVSESEYIVTGITEAAQ